MNADETKKFPYFKLFLGLLCVLAIVLGAFLVEKAIGSAVKDVTIDKADIGETVRFINVRPLSTKIMAVRASDGSCRLAFEECLSCYYNEGVRAHFTDTGKSVVCDNCGCETFYDDLGVLSDECTPIPILSGYVTEDETAITVPKDFLERCKEVLDVLRIGKGNYANIYDGGDYMNMDITEASDVAVSYDDGEADEDNGPADPAEIDRLLSRSEDITKLYNGYLNDVTLNASQSDIGVFDACYKEFLGLCDELAEDGGVSAARAADIGEKFDGIEEKIREIGRKSAK